MATPIDRVLVLGAPPPLPPSTIISAHKQQKPQRTMRDKGPDGRADWSVMLSSIVIYRAEICGLSARHRTTATTDAQRRRQTTMSDDDEMNLQAHWGRKHLEPRQQLSGRARQRRPPSWACSIYDHLTIDSPSHCGHKLDCIQCGNEGHDSANSSQSN
jgi:hypothetical protein